MYSVHTIDVIILYFPDKTGEDWLIPVLLPNHLSYKKINLFKSLMMISLYDIDFGPDRPYLDY